MHSSFTIANFRTGTHGRVIIGAIAMLISGCVNSITPQDNSAAAEPAAPGDIYDCSNPAAGGQKLASICIVFDTTGCPVYTVYNGKLNALPELHRAAGENGADKLRWQAVQLLSNGTYSGLAADYRIFFDPFQGAPIKSTGNKGQATSKPLGCSGSRCELPGGVDFKYTVQAVSPAACDPLDPMFRVN